MHACSCWNRPLNSEGRKTSCLRVVNHYHTFVQSAHNVYLLISCLTSGEPVLSSPVKLVWAPGMVTRPKWYHCRSPWLCLLILYRCHLVSPFSHQIRSLSMTLRLPNLEGETCAKNRLYMCTQGAIVSTVSQVWIKKIKKWRKERKER